MTRDPTGQKSEKNTLIPEIQNLKRQIFNRTINKLVGFRLRWTQVNFIRKIKKNMFIKIGLISGWVRNCAKIQPADFQPEPG